MLIKIIYFTFNLFITTYITIIIKIYKSIYENMTMNIINFIYSTLKYDIIILFKIILFSSQNSLYLSVIQTHSL